jgi:hypothetical protein
MKREKFNKKYAMYIEDGFIGCELTNKTSIKYLDQEFQRLIDFDGFKFSQIIMKNANCYFYCINVPNGIVERIQDTIDEIYFNA